MADVECRSCHGSGGDPEDSTRDCFRCNGSGYIPAEPPPSQEPSPPDAEIEKFIHKLADCFEAEFAESGIDIDMPRAVAMVREFAAGRASTKAEQPLVAAGDEVGRRMREGRQLLRRMVKYVREDRAVTPGCTRLERLTNSVDDYLRRTHRASDLLRGDDTRPQQTFLQALSELNPRSELCKCGCPKSLHVPRHAHSKLSVGELTFCTCFVFEPVYPLQPTNAELVETMRGGAHWPLCDARRCCARCNGWDGALTELARRIGVAT